VIVRIAVQQQHRRAGAAMTHADDRALGADVEMLEARKQRRNLGAAPARGIADIIGGRRFGDDRALVCESRRRNGRGGACGQGLDDMAAAQVRALCRFGLGMRGHVRPFQ
jgi:hypothetical protein